jgi:hypothetical protein
VREIASADYVQSFQQRILAELLQVHVFAGRPAETAVQVEVRKKLRRGSRHKTTFS